MIPFALGFFRKGTRFPKACTGIGNHVSPWHFIGKRRSKRREVKIWLTILHSLDSLVQWDQWVWNGDMAKAKIEMASNTDRDRDVEKSFYRNSETSTSSSKSMPEAESEPTRYRHVMFIFVLWLIFAVIVFLLFRQIMFTPWICHCSQIYVFYICFLRILNTSISLNIQTKTK